MTRLSTIAALAVLALAVSAGAAAAATPGDLDPSFDGDGKRILPFDGYPQVTLVQPDGKIVIVSFEQFGSSFTVRRLGSDGSLDPSFDGDGTAVVTFGGQAWAYAAALQPDGKIVVAGTLVSSNQGVMARFDSDGSLDETFDPGGGDGDGKKVVPGMHGIAAVLVQPDGKLILAGHYYASFTVVRLDSKGAPDGTTFDAAVIETGNSEYVNAAALAPDGRIVLAGVTIPYQEPQRAAFAVYKLDGTLDKSFAGTGTLSLKPDPLGGAKAVQVQPDGKIVAAGDATVSDPRMVAVRLDQTGSPDATFGTGGSAVADFPGQDRPRRSPSRRTARSCSRARTTRRVSSRLRASRRVACLTGTSAPMGGPSSASTR